MQDISKRANHELLEISFVVTKLQNPNANANIANSNIRKISGFGAQLATSTIARDGKIVKQRQMVPQMLLPPIHQMP